MMDLVFGSILANVLSYVPFALLYILAFRKALRFSLKTTLIIMAFSAVLRVLFIELARSASSATAIYNCLDFVILLAFGVLAAKSTVGRMLFIGLMLKNTADAVVVFSKFLEYLVNPEWAQMGYHWTYSVSMAVVELALLPICFYVIKRFFTNEISRSISRKWHILWIIPFFFYLLWIFVFYVPSGISDLELACRPVNSAFLLVSISCQYLIYVSIAALVQSLQNEMRLEAENHAIHVQSLQYEHMRDQIDEDRKLRHDMRHHFMMISSLAESREYDELDKYISEYVTPSLWRSNVHYCSNTFLNIMASYYANKCVTNNISCVIKLNVPEAAPLTDTEITILFGNLLENAFEACMCIPEGEPREIVFLGNVINGDILFSIKNTYVNEVKKTSKGLFHSTKHDGAGIGVSSCMNIMKKYNGTIDFVAGDMFTVNLYFNHSVLTDASEPHGGT